MSEPRACSGPQTTSGIRASRDSGNGTANNRVGKAPTAMTGIKANKATGTTSQTAGDGSATTAMSTESGATAGHGLTAIETRRQIDGPFSNLRNSNRDGAW